MAITSTACEEGFHEQCRLRNCACPHHAQDRTVIRSVPVKAWKVIVACNECEFSYEGLKDLAFRERSLHRARTGHYDFKKVQFIPVR